MDFPAQRPASRDDDPGTQKPVLFQDEIFLLQSAGEILNAPISMWANRAVWTLEQE